MGRFQVIVNNLGTVYDGASSVDANKIYKAYIQASKEPHGRASGESVIMLKDDEIMREYEGTLQDE